MQEIGNAKYASLSLLSYITQMSFDLSSVADPLQADSMQRHLCFGVSFFLADVLPQQIPGTHIRKYLRMYSARVAVAMHAYRAHYTTQGYLRM